MEELKPCPFCGGDARLVKRDGATLVYCTKCERGTGLCRGDAAATMWNHRPAEDALKAEVERLKAELDAQKSVLKIAYSDIKRLCEEVEKWKKIAEGKERGKMSENKTCGECKYFNPESTFDCPLGHEGTCEAQEKVKNLKKRNDILLQTVSLLKIFIKQERDFTLELVKQSGDFRSPAFFKCQEYNQLIEIITDGEKKLKEVAE